VLDPKKQPRSQSSPEDAVFASNMMGQTAEELAQELEWSAAAPRRKPVEKIAAHYSVSLTPRERLSRKQMGAVTRQLLKEMGHDRCAYFAVQHHDQEHKRGVQHWHVVTATVNTRNQWVNDSFSKRRTRQVERSLEAQFGLISAPTRPIADQKNLTTGEARRKERTGEVLPKEKLWAAVDKATADKPTMALLVTRLKAQDVEVHLRRAGDRYTGISFGLNGSAFAGGRLGRSYSFGGLQKYRGVYYDPMQDDTLQQVANASPDKCQKKLTDYEAYQQTLRELYAHYAGQSKPGLEPDQVVATRAISAGRSEREIVEIIRQGEPAQELRTRFGQGEAIDYSRQLVQAQLEHWRRSQAYTQKQRQRRQRQPKRSQLEL
jgi:hypothetical protein